jgi:hypothetical protein
MPAIVFCSRVRKNFCPGTRMARSYTTYAIFRGQARSYR